jgi:aspartate racemase
MIGIVGGVGPYAGLDLAKNVFNNTLADSDQEHLPLVMLSVPETILDRTEYLLEIVNDNPGRAIARVILRMEAVGATVIGIPCNTAYATDIFNLTRQVLTENNAQIVLLSLIDETIKAIIAEYPNFKKIGVLSTTGTYKFKIYTAPLNNAGLAAIVPPIDIQEKIVHPAIYDKGYGIKAKSNPVSEKARTDLLAMIDLLKQNGAELIIKGCSEIAMAIPEQMAHGVPLIDPSNVLARSLIKHVNPQKLKPVKS